MTHLRESAQVQRSLPVIVYPLWLTYRPSHVYSEVRRAALFQLDVHPSTLPSILSRQRDVDPLNRRLLYTNALAELPGIGVLTLQQREDIVRFGLKDREEGVRRASGRLIANWAKKIADDLVKERAEGGEASSTEDIIDGSVAVSVPSCLI